MAGFGVVLRWAQLASEHIALHSGWSNVGEVRERKREKGPRTSWGCRSTFWRYIRGTRPSGWILQPPPSEQRFWWEREPWKERGLSEFTAHLSCCWCTQHLSLESAEATWISINGCGVFDSFRVLSQEEISQVCEWRRNFGRLQREVGNDGRIQWRTLLENFPRGTLTNFVDVVFTFFFVILLFFFDGFEAVFCGEEDVRLWLWTAAVSTSWVKSKLHVRNYVMSIQFCMTFGGQRILRDYCEDN